MRPPLVTEQPVQVIGQLIVFGGFRSRAQSILGGRDRSIADLGTKTPSNPRY